MIQLEDGTTGFIQAGLPDSNLQSLQLEDGSTAYISLFGDGGSGALSIDSTPQAHDLHAPLQVTNSTLSLSKRYLRFNIKYNYICGAK